MPFNFFDILIVLIFAYFSVSGFIRGFCKEIFGIIGFIAGIWLAYTYHPMVSPYLTIIEHEVWRTLASYAIIFIATNIIASACSFLLRSILTLAMLPWADRLAGCILGFAKAVLLSSLIIIILQSVLGYTNFLEKSFLLPYLTNFVENIRTYIPQEIFTINIPQNQ